MGDSILVRSLIEHIKARNPELEIGVLVSPATREAMTIGASYNVHQYTQRALTVYSALDCLREIRRCHYDAILNFEQRSTAGAAFLAMTGIRFRLGFLPTVESPKARFFTHAVRFQEGWSMWTSFIKLAQMVDSRLPGNLMPLPLKCSTRSEAWAETWLYQHSAGSRPVAIHLGSQGMEFRRWPANRFVDLAERLRIDGASSILLTGTPSERPLIQEFIARYSGHALDASDAGSLEHTAALLKRCDLLISNDTGIMHLAAAMGTATVGLFGPNSPNQWSPIGPWATYVYETRVPCSPCLNLYANRWPLECANSEKSRCMLDIQVDTVLDTARRIVSAKWAEKIGEDERGKFLRLH